MAKKKPRAALAAVIGDVHYTPQTVHLANASVEAAQEAATELGVPLVLNGDTLDTKVVLRGECVNALIDQICTYPDVLTYVNVGNHDLFNEKSKEHALHFLSPYAEVVDRVRRVDTENGVFTIIPYMSDLSMMQQWLAVSIPQDKGPLIMHQGVQTAYMGHYAQDRTSLPPEAFNRHRVLGSHYHRRQTIKCGDSGLFTYIGNPYTLSFGEANDGPKGFAILYNDGSIEFVDLPLRKHVILDVDLYKASTFDRPNPGDLVWLKLRGPESDLATVKKKDLVQITGTEDFRLDLIPYESNEVEPKAPNETVSGQLLLDDMIDATNETPEQKANLKKAWRNLLETA